MGTKPMILLFMFIGSTLGGFVPMLWGDSAFSFTGIFFDAVGAIVGIWIGYRLSNW